MSRGISVTTPEAKKTSARSPVMMRRGPPPRTSVLGMSHLLGPDHLDRDRERAYHSSVPAQYDAAVQVEVGRRLEEAPALRVEADRPVVRGVRQVVEREKRLERPRPAGPLPSDPQVQQRIRR